MWSSLWQNANILLFHLWRSLTEGLVRNELETWTDVRMLDIMVISNEGTPFGTSDKDVPIQSFGFKDRENRLDDATHGDIMGQTLPSRGTYNSSISTR